MKQKDLNNLRKTSSKIEDAGPVIIELLDEIQILRDLCQRALTQVTSPYRNGQELSDWADDYYSHFGDETE